MSAYFETLEELYAAVETAFNSMVGWDFPPGMGEKVVQSTLRISGLSEESAASIWPPEAINAYITPWLRGCVAGQIQALEMMQTQARDSNAARDQMVAEQMAARAEAERIAAEEAAQAEADRIAAEEAANNQQP